MGLKAELGIMRNASRLRTVANSVTLILLALTWASAAVAQGRYEFTELARFPSDFFDVSAPSINERGDVVFYAGRGDCGTEEEDYYLFDSSGLRVIDATVPPAVGVIGQQITQSFFDQTVLLAHPSLGFPIVRGTLNTADGNITEFSHDLFPLAMNELQEIVFEGDNHLWLGSATTAPQQITSAGSRFTGYRSINRQAQTPWKIVSSTPCCNIELGNDVETTRSFTDTRWIRRIRTNNHGELAYHGFLTPVHPQQIGVDDGRGLGRTIGGNTLLAINDRRDILGFAANGTLAVLNVYSAPNFQPETLAAQTQSLLGNTVYNVHAGSYGLNNAGQIAFIARIGPISSWIGCETPSPPWAVFRADPKPALLAIEVVQSIQDFNNSIPLIEHKTTLVRAHFSHLEPGTNALLAGNRNGAALPGSPLHPITGRIPLDPDGKHGRASANGSVFFEIPISWSSGDVEFEVMLTDPDLVCLESAGSAANDCKVDVSFEPVPPPRIRFYSVVWNDAGTFRKIGQSGAAALANRLTAALPVASVNWDHGETIWPFVEPPDGSKLVRTLGEVLRGLRFIRLADGCTEDAGCTDFYHGGIQFGGAGLASRPGFVGASYVPRGNFGFGRQTHSHELGHNLGLPHAVDSALGTPNGRKQGYCGERSDLATPDFPYINTVIDSGVVAQRPTIGPIEGDQNAVVWGVDMDADRLVDPTVDYALMGYCTNARLEQWPSKNNYVAMKNKLQTLAVPTTKVTTPPGDVRLITGSVDLDDGSVVFDSSLTLSQIPTPSLPAAGDLELRLLDAGGGTIQSVFVAPRPYEDAADRSIAHFFVAVPEDAALHSIEALWLGASQAIIAASPGIPEVTIVEPAVGAVLGEDSIVLTWTGTDADGDTLSYLVQYSPDGGATWRSLVADYSGNSVELAHDQFVASDNGQIRVTVSDGFNTASTVRSGFSVSNNAPATYINNPEQGRLYVGTDIIMFQAVALDTEEGNLTGDALVWSSDLDGPLGTGALLELAGSTLSEGVHLITATGTDADGLLGSAQVEIQIAHESPAELVDLAVTIGKTTELIPLNTTVATVLEVTNQGPEVATNVVLEISSNTSVQVELVSSPTGWDCAALTCITPALSIGLIEEFELELTTNTLQDGEITATVSGEIQDWRSINNQQVLRFGVTEDNPDVLFFDGFE